MNAEQNIHDEFYWEREIRNDEKRISCYYRELSLCLDLPGEASIIMDNLMAQPGLIPPSTNNQNLRFANEEESPFEDDDFEDEESQENANYRTFNEALTEELDKIICAWNTIFATKTHARNRKKGLAISCALGKIFIRLSDFSSTNTPEKIGLKICLGKRSIHDISECIGMIFELTDSQKNLALIAAPIVDELQHLRERILDTLAQIRKKP